MVSAKEWGDVGAWVMSTQGPGSQLPVMVRPWAARVPPMSLGPWSWGTVAVAAGRPGGRLALTGEGYIDEPWVRGGQAHRAFVSTVDGPAVAVLEPGGPVGSWELVSAQGFGQVFGARGVRFDFATDGGLNVVLADAFVGPLAALEIAEEVGTSGVAQAGWSVTGRMQLTFEGVAATSMTLHDRTGGGRDNCAMTGSWTSGGATFA